MTNEIEPSDRQRQKQYKALGIDKHDYGIEVCEVCHKPFESDEHICKNKKYLCNYHFVAECHDINPHPNESECSGLSEEDSRKGLACDNWIKKHEVAG